MKNEQKTKQKNTIAKKTTTQHLHDAGHRIRLN